MRSRWEVGCDTLRVVHEDAKVHLGLVWRFGDGDEGCNFTFFTVFLCS
jgi:hypothetical protein